MEPRLSALLSNAVFFCGRVPKEVSELSIVLRDIDRSTFKEMLKLLITEIEGHEVTSQMYFTLRDAANKPFHFDKAFSGLHRLIRSVISRDPMELTIQDLEKDLRHLKFTEEEIADFCSAVMGNRREQLQAFFRDQGPRIDGVAAVSHKIDVTVSSTDEAGNAKVWVPCILLWLKTSSGEILNGEMSLDDFHHLRYNVAQALKTLDVMENRLEGR